MHTQAPDSAIQMPEIISALSFALDLTEGADPGHALRTTLLGMRIGLALGLPRPMLAPLYYALQLKDVGCSSNAARMANLFGGDDRRAKALSKLTDWTGLLSGGAGNDTLRARFADVASGMRTAPRNLRALWAIVLPGAPLRSKLGRLRELSAQTEANTRELITLRCDRGASILRKLRVSDLASESVRHLDEHWDGSGYPSGLRGQAIPILSRISAVAQSLDAFATAQGAAQSVRTLQRRSGTYFDPEVVSTALALHRGGLLWQGCRPGTSTDESRRLAMSLSPEPFAVLETEEIDTICEAFAEVVDAKSPFTFRHSLGVTETAVSLAQELDLSPARQKLLKRAALLHDLGKLGVSNNILDKRGPLTIEERATVQAHPLMSRTILSRISGFSLLARIAGEHHERLDGSGYPDGLAGEQLCLESRVLALADCFAALAEERPYRAALPLERVLSILAADVPRTFDPTVFEALQSAVARWNGHLPGAFQTTLATCDLIGDPASLVPALARG